MQVLAGWWFAAWVTRHRDPASRLKYPSYRFHMRCYCYLAGGMPLICFCCALRGLSSCTCQPRGLLEYFKGIVAHVIMKHFVLDHFLGYVALFQAFP